ncbi:MAG TPA: serine/threonine-protein kinase, partial [Pirellulales bacterium]|nr:serine/threonine-protein kinase [Pirellulales bacterium]
RVVPRGKQGDQNAPTYPAASADPERGVPIELAAHGRYRIVRRLGSGGMGDVYLAEHRLMERLVAVKVILPELVSSSTLIERFHREVKAAARLAHPNIVTAHDAEQAGNLHFLAMEYVAGVDLAQVVAKHGPLPVLKACHFVRQAALGLQHAFEKGMVHRDIKPQNLMLTPKGQVKILDFGIARFAREKIAPASLTDSEVAALVPGGTQLTASGSVMGTADYMAPEQAIDARQADTRADIYSLGCTFYYLLTGQVPFPGGTFVDKIMRHAEEHWTSPERLRPEVPHEVVEIVNKMMAKNPARRFQTPAEVAKALERVIRAAPAKPEADAAPAKQGPTRAATSVAKSSTYPVVQQRTPAPIDIAAILQAELPPLPPPERYGRARRQADKQRSNSWRYLIGSGLAVPLVAAAWAIASVFRVGPATGTLEVVSPVAVAVKQGGQTVKLIEPNDAASFELPAGDYQLVLAEARDELVLSSEQVTVKSGVPQSVHVTKKPKATAPSPAVATEATAKPIGALPPRVKNLAPSVKIANVEPEAPEAGGSLTIHLTGFDPEDDPITFEYRTGLNEPWHDAPNSLVVLRELGSGPLTVEVRALDSAGNPSEGVTHSVEVKPAATQTPPLAIAPFSAEQARRHQEAWASYLECEIEETNSIGMKLALIPP